MGQSRPLFQFISVCFFSLNGAKVKKEKLEIAQNDFITAENDFKIAQNDFRIAQNDFATKI